MWFERARHKSKREVELLVATLNPKPDVPSIVRKLPTLIALPAQPVPPSRREETATPDVSAPIATPRCVPPEPRPSEVKPLAPERFKIQFTVSRDTYERLRHAQNLLRHVVPDGDPAIIFERALTLLVAELERTRTGKAGASPHCLGSEPDFSSHSSRGETNCVAARQRAVRLQWCTRSVHRNWVPRVSPRRSVCRRR